MVASESGGSDSSRVPGIQELLQAYVDRTGDSTRDMARKVDDAINYQRFSQLLRKKSTRLAYDRKTISALAGLLQVPEATIVKGYLVDLGLPVDDNWSRLAQMLPPGVEQLDSQDVDAITYVVRRLVEARKAATKPAPEAGGDSPSKVRPIRVPKPDLSQVAARRGESEGRTARKQQDDDAERGDE